MRIANYKNGLSVNITEEEARVLGEGRFNMDVDFKREARSWLRVQTDERGIFRFGAQNKAGEFVFRQTHPNGTKLQRFGAESVATWTPGAGTLFGAKPTMNRPVILRRPVVGRRSPAPRAAVPKAMQDVTYELVHDAVRIINSFACQHDDVELAINEQDGVKYLVMRMLIEFGK